MATLKMKGAWTALVTPFTETGDIDWATFEKSIEFQISQGITGVLPVGTTGESPTLTWDEHETVIERAIRFVNKRTGVLAGTGSNSTDEALAGSRHARDLGADAVLLVDCYYNGPSSLELRDHYHGAVAEAVPEITVVPYVIPGRTGCALGVEDLAILAARHPNVSAVKEATGDLDRMRRERALLPEPFSIMSGDDDLTHTLMTDPAIAANGVISVISNVCPAGVQAMTAALASGDTGTAAAIRDALNPLFGLVVINVENERVLPGGRTVTVKDKFRNPLGVKTLMAGLGLCSGVCRRPLGLMTASGVRKVRDAAATVLANSPQWLEPLADHYGVDLEARIRDDAVWDALTA